MRAGFLEFFVFFVFCPLKTGGHFQNRGVNFFVKKVVPFLPVSAVMDPTREFPLGTRPTTEGQPRSPLLALDCRLVGVCLENPDIRTPGRFCRFRFFAVGLTPGVPDGRDRNFGQS